MRLLRWEALCAIVGFALTLTFILVPGPYPMALFTFISQPLFGIVAVGYLLKVRATCENAASSECSSRTRHPATSLRARGSAGMLWRQLGGLRVYGTPLATPRMCLASLTAPHSAARGQTETVSGRGTHHRFSAA